MYSSMFFSPSSSNLDCMAISCDRMSRESGTHEQPTCPDIESTAPHAWNEDILILIFDQFQVDHLDPIGLATLAHSTLVCREWYEVCVKALYRTLHHSIFPLYLILLPFPWSDRNELTPDEEPSDAWTNHIEKILEMQPHQSSSASWSRFLFHASHVRTILNWSPGGKEVRLLSLLMQHNGNRTFLPSLRSVDLCCDFPNVPDLSVVLPTTTTSIEYNTVETISKDQLKTLVSELAARVPSLTSLTLSAWAIEHSFILPTVSCSFESLRNLHFGRRMFITPEDCAQTSYTWLSNLRSFTGAVQGSEGYESIIDMPSLRDLDINGDGASILGLLTHWRTPSITHIGLLVREGSLTTTLFPPQSIYPALHTFSLLTLIQLQPDTNASDERESTPIPEVVQLIAPLLVNKGLQNVDITHRMLVQLSDAGVLALAQAWPALRVLRLELPPNAPTLPTLAALGAFARHCPQLEVLTMSFDVQAVSELPSAESLSPPHPLRRFIPLIRGWAADALPKDVARYLHVHFPRIEVNDRDQSGNVPWGCTFDQQWTEMWVEIVALQSRDRREECDRSL